MSEKSIKIEGLGKQYRLGVIGTGTLSHDLNRMWARIRGKEDPYSKIGESNDRTSENKGDYVWALRNVSFELNKGDVLGVIGRNGAGKSTLLKLLSRITSPTEGEINFNGRLAALLEVGTGFHPELTGRENVFLNGAILGMSKSEIQEKFDEIVEFSGCAAYIDTPVKRYSSGMLVRLGFSVAAHLETDILVVDEVLAVGDLEFQQKCLGKMNEVSKSGRTVLFVSHNMQAVGKLCTKGLYLKDGEMQSFGDINTVLDDYVRSLGDELKSYLNEEELNHEEVRIREVKVLPKDSSEQRELLVGEPWAISVKFELGKGFEHIVVAAGISGTMDEQVNTTWSSPLNLDSGVFEVQFTNLFHLATGTYYLTIGLSNYERSLEYHPNVISFTISEVAVDNLHPRILRTKGNGLILNQMEEKVSKLK
ncbi:MAG: ABC transporter ATP-binding protein [Crocinitomicaceae bacterium]|nr:ABC transporter ATP-binding protein [Crocinitomicaceae bacterium]